MVAQQVLVLFVQVRILVVQRTEAPESITTAGVFCFYPKKDYFCIKSLCENNNTTKYEIYLLECERATGLQG